MKISVDCRLLLPNVPEPPGCGAAWALIELQIRKRGKCQRRLEAGRRRGSGEGLETRREEEARCYANVVAPGSPLVGNVIAFENSLKWRGGGGGGEDPR